MNHIAIIGTGPTGIYALKHLIECGNPLKITIFERNADPGKGTPYHPHANDRAMLANIASIEIPPIGLSLLEWLRSLNPTDRQAMGVLDSQLHDREFFPRIVLGDYFASQFEALLLHASEAGHEVTVLPNEQVFDIEPIPSCVQVYSRNAAGQTSLTRFDHVILATGHRWEEKTEIHPGYFISPWPASQLETVGNCEVAVLGTSLSAIDAVVSLATRKGMFIRDQFGELIYSPDAGSEDFRLVMMSRKGILPEAEFYCPLPYLPLKICTPSAMDDLVAKGPIGLLDQVFDLFKQELLLADPDYAHSVGLSLRTVEDFASAFFADRQSTDPFLWAAQNLAQAKQNMAQEYTVPWRYAILCMHEVILRAIPHLHSRDLERFHHYLKPIFVDDYATVPHQSIERLLALHRVKKLRIDVLGDDYTLERDLPLGAAVVVKGARKEYKAFVDATGQSSLNAEDMPFPRLVQAGLLKRASTASGAELIFLSGERPSVDTGGVEIDAQFRPLFLKPVSNNIYCLAIPFLLHKLPFVQGITSSAAMAQHVARYIVGEFEKGVPIMESVSA